MVHIGLTGGIGSGKSTVARMFADLGATVLDADALSRELTAPGREATGLIAALFGPKVLAPDGSVDRKALATEVFGEEDKRRRLEEVLHPRIVARRREILREIGQRDGDAVVLSEAALIFEAGTQGEFDAVVLVTAPVEVRRERLRLARWDAGTVEARIASQWPEERKRPLARWIVDNADGPESTRSQVTRIWEEIASWRSAGPRHRLIDER
jgi:dephospho-CoA kinase